MSDTFVLLVLYVTVLAVCALATVVPWVIGLGWMLHHWFGV